MATIDITKFNGANSLSERMKREFNAPEVNSINRVDLNCTSLFQNFVFWARNDSSLLARGTQLILTVATVASCVVYVGIVIIKNTAIEFDRQRTEESTIKQRIKQHITQQLKLPFVLRDILKDYSGKNAIPLMTIKDRIQHPLFAQGDAPIKIIELKADDALPTYLLAIRTIHKTNSQEHAEYTFAPSSNNFQMNMHCIDQGVISNLSEEWDELALTNNLSQLMKGNDDAILYT